MLISFVVLFPLISSMKGAFQRREEAIENIDAVLLSTTPKVKRISMKVKHTQVKRCNCKVCGNCSDNVKCNGAKQIKVVMKWNGKCWQSVNKSIRCQLNLRRDLLSLVERCAIKEDALNSLQKEYIQMYKYLFIDL